MPPELRIERYSRASLVNRFPLSIAWQNQNRICGCFPGYTLNPHRECLTASSHGEQPKLEEYGLNKRRSWNLKIQQRNIPFAYEECREFGQELP